ncbi:hypothetical protein COLO4_25909 [Corchorus olitorius]|uniref:Uncharacterized protein n=1 Tax=Corchorus olitorius TaxID=93759 RepID=A0A1R3HZH1_9ROSI|nr:hypothetical protein COLO4_25909 [Corchorus olitorius]
MPKTKWKRLAMCKLSLERQQANDLQRDNGRLINWDWLHYCGNHKKKTCPIQLQSGPGERRKK